jgi:hypothetical protein
MFDSLMEVTVSTQRGPCTLEPDLNRLKLSFWPSVARRRDAPDVLSAQIGFNHFIGFD